MTLLMTPLLLYCQARKLRTCKLLLAQGLESRVYKCDGTDADIQALKEGDFFISCKACFKTLAVENLNTGSLNQSFMRTPKP